MMILSRRAALTVGAGIVAAPALVRTAAAEGSLDAAGAAPVDLSPLARVRQELVAPPFVHAHEQVATTGPRVVEFETTTVEKEIEADRGARLRATTFDGAIPGPMMVAHEGHSVELTRRNPASNLLQDGIDFHAATGALGGGR